MFGDQADRLCEQGVARQDRGVLTERAVASRATATQIVIIHRRQVVMDQRVGVDQLQGGGGRQQLVRVVAESFACRQTQHRANAFPTGQQRVAHRLDEPLGATDLATIVRCLGCEVE